jgi:hypothetical protein
MADRDAKHRGRDAGVERLLSYDILVASASILA